MFYSVCVAQLAVFNFFPVLFVRRLLLVCAHQMCDSTFVEFDLYLEARVGSVCVRVCSLKLKSANVQNKHIHRRKLVLSSACIQPHFIAYNTRRRRWRNEEAEMKCLYVKSYHCAIHKASVFILHRIRFIASCRCSSLYNLLNLLCPLPSLSEHHFSSSISHTACLAALSRLLLSLSHFLLPPHLFLAHFVYFAHFIFFSPFFGRILEAECSVLKIDVSK